MGSAQTCDYCKDEAYLGFTCRRCNGYFCQKHRLPEMHECTRIRMDPRLPGEKKKIALENKGTSQTAPQEVPEKKIYNASELNLDGDTGVSRVRVPMKLNLFLPLIPFVLFAIFDVIALISGQFTALVSLGIHAVFLPALFYNARKFSRGKVNFKSMATFYKSIFAYALIYISTSIMLSILIGDVFGLLIFILVGFQMLLWWARWKFVRKIFNN